MKIRKKPTFQRNTKFKEINERFIGLTKKSENIYFLLECIIDLRKKN